MDTKNRITISWSGGKDSALALYNLREVGEFEISHIHTVIDRDLRRVGLHGVREELIDRQAARMEKELVKGYLGASEGSRNYEQLVREMYRNFRREGITHIMFGDIFLEDLREYREKLLEDSGLIPVYPLWKKDSMAMLDEFSDAGFKTIICAVNEACYEAGLLGQMLNKSLPFPAGVDPCGENGEFHSFVFDGPIFHGPVPVTLGEVASRSYDYTVIENGSEKKKNMKFYFQDLFS